MDHLQQLLHDKGAIITDIEILQGQIEALKAKLGPVNQELVKLLNERNAPAAPVKEETLA